MNIFCTGNQQWEITSRSCLGVDGVTDLEVNGTHVDHLGAIKIKVLYNKCKYEEKI